jgi:Tol biopolymer transport system component
MLASAVIVDTTIRRMELGRPGGRPHSSLQSSLQHPISQLSLCNRFSTRNRLKNRSYRKKTIKPSLTETRIAYLASRNCISNRYWTKNRSCRKQTTNPLLTGTRFACLTFGFLTCVVLAFSLLGVAVQATSAEDAKVPGNRILFADSGTLFVTDPDGASLRKIADHVYAAALSSGANLIAYADIESVHVLSLADNHSVYIAPITEGHVDSIAWSPDQKLLAYDVEVPKRSWNLFLASYPPNDASPNTPRNLGPWNGPINFSPDGKFILHPSFRPAEKAAEQNILETLNVETRQRATIYRSSAKIWDAKYSPDDSSIAFSITGLDSIEDLHECGGAVRDLWLLPLRSKRVVRIANGVFDFDWSPDGRSLAVGTGTEDCGYPPGDGAVLISSADGKVQFRISKNAPSLGAKSSPDGKKLIFVDFKANQLVIADVARRTLTPVPGPNSRASQYVIYDWK